MTPFTQQEKDTLHEIASIGAVNASTALSKLIYKTINVQMTHLDKVKILDLPKILQETTKDVIAILFTIKGEIPGRIALINTQETGIKIASLLQKKKTLTKLNPAAQSALQEMGNIVVGSYLTALSDFSGINMLESTPLFFQGTEQQVLKRVAEGYPQQKDCVLVVETKLHIDKEKFSEDLILIFQQRSFGMLFKKLTKKIR